MFQNVAPEQVGIRSENVLNYLKTLEERGLYMHSVVMARGNEIFCEAYWKPFHKNALHRMYSTTKSYVGIAVTELAAEGKISLNDKVVSYFPDEVLKPVHPYLEAMTIRHMLTMETCCLNSRAWFEDNVTDRVRHYFDAQPTRYPGTYFEYDSEGSFVLGALVERVTGKTLLAYLREKCLDEIGFSKEARCLKAPGGHSWGDSALLCTARDQLAFGRLLGNGGVWNGKQLLHPEAVAEATKKHVDTVSSGISSYGSMGYGYQIWRCYDDAFAFYGMHDQLMIYHPKTDITFVCTAGNAAGVSRAIIIDNFYKDIINQVANTAIAEDGAQEELLHYCENLKLMTVRGNVQSNFEETINHQTFLVDPNPMGITEFTFHFDKDGGTFAYVNKHGTKELKFGRKANVFQQFPESGYSKDVGGMRCEGHTYRCAVSGAWIEDEKFSMIVQVIDDYIGILNITIGFNDNHALVKMQKHAEDFMDNYSGSAVAHR